MWSFSADVFGFFGARDAYGGGNRALTFLPSLLVDGLA